MRKADDQEEIARIATILDGLEPAPGGSVLCPKDSGEQYTLTFWSVGKSTPIANSAVSVSGCRFVTVTIHGRKPHGYQRNDELTALLAHLDP